ncbi:probable cytosolic oligopeptidase A [Tanacetum coccineum]
MIVNWCVKFLVTVYVVPKKCVEEQYLVAHRKKDPHLYTKEEVEKLMYGGVISDDTSCLEEASAMVDTAKSSPSGKTMKALAFAAEFTTTMHANYLLSGNIADEEMSDEEQKKDNQVRRQDSSITFGAPVRANMRTAGLTTTTVTLSLLQTKFGKLITDKKEIEGFSATTLGLAAKATTSKGDENATAKNWPRMITLDAPSFMSVMQHAINRALREEIYRKAKYNT